MLLSQNEMIAMHLKEYGSITAREAYNNYGIMRLSARIHDLRATGMNIDTTEETKPNRYGVKTRYARYSLHEDK